MVKCVRLRLEGRVQGVGFRFFAKRLASEHGVTGYARNLPGGSVEILACGGDLQAFLDRVARGPVLARVERVEREEVTIPSPQTSFLTRS